MFDKKVCDEILYEFSDYLLNFVGKNWVGLVRVPQSEDRDLGWVYMLGVKSSKYNFELYSKLIDIIKSKTREEELCNYIDTLVARRGFSLDMTDIEFNSVPIDTEIPVTLYINLEDKFDNCDYECVKVDDDVKTQIMADFMKFVLNFVEFAVDTLEMYIDENCTTCCIRLHEYSDTLFNELTSITKRHIKESDDAVSIARVVYQEFIHRRYLDISVKTGSDIHMKERMNDGARLVLQFRILYDEIRKVLGTSVA